MMIRLREEFENLKYIIEIIKFKFIFYFSNFHNFFNLTNNLNFT